MFAIQILGFLPASFPNKKAGAAVRCKGVYRIAVAIRSRDPPSCLFYLSSKQKERARMVEAFCATWKLTDSQNFDEYMKALGR